MGDDLNEVRYLTQWRAQIVKGRKRKFRPDDIGHVSLPESEFMPVSRTPFATASGLNEHRYMIFLDRMYDPIFDALGTPAHRVANYFHHYKPAKPTLAKHA